MYTVTKDVILPATITGSWPRPRWYDQSMFGRPLDTCMMDTQYREKFGDFTRQLQVSNQLASKETIETIK